MVGRLPLEPQPKPLVRTVMISNISPCGLNYEDTHNTLKYANRAKEIKTMVSANVSARRARLM